MGGFTVIGDVHGHIDKYLELRKQFSHTVQIGDMGFDYDNIPENDDHLFFMGNHDNYWKSHRSNMGDFGKRELNGVAFFFIRGGFSIDWPQRTIGVNLWSQEELSDEQMSACLIEYSKARPNIVLSHECPESVSRILFPNRFILESWGYDEKWASNTQIFLEELFLIHQPKLWCFGHFHSRRDRMIQGTRFVCVEELRTFNVE